MKEGTSPDAATAASPPHSSLHAVTLAWRGTLASEVAAEAGDGSGGGAPIPTGSSSSSSSSVSSSSSSASTTSASASSARDSQPEPAAAEELGVAALLEALQKAVSIFDMLGPMMAPAVKNDLANCAKVRKAWEDLGRPSSLRALLEAELRSGMHKPAKGRGEPRVLKDPSAAIALVWVRRSVAFQTAVLGAMADDRAASLSVLAGDAYKAHLERYHTWILKSTFRMGLNAMPSRAEFLQKLGGEALADAPERDGIVYADVEELARVQEQLVRRIGQLLVDLEIEAGLPGAS